MSPGRSLPPRQALLAGPGHRQGQHSPSEAGFSLVKPLSVVLMVCAALGLAGALLLAPMAPKPQLILVLGGVSSREAAAARLSGQRNLPVLVSGGSNPAYVRWIFQQEGIDEGQLALDYTARDTLGNFITVLPELKRRGIRHVLLVTTTDHMPRALLVGRISAGSRGIRFTPHAVDCGDHCWVEPPLKIWTDVVRALVWAVSKQDLRNWVGGSGLRLPFETGQPQRPPGGVSGDQHQGKQALSQDPAVR